MVLLPISVSAQYTTYSGTSPNEFFSQESDAAVSNQDVSAQGCNSGYYPCGTNCWKCDSSSDVFTCYNSQPYCCPGGYPIYCAKTNGCWKSAEACDNAQKCGNEDWTVCSNPSYPNWNCKPDGQSTCCISGKPYYWNGNCQECPQDKPNKCGSTCYSGSECGSKVTVCDKNNNVVCCASDYPNYCARTDSCWKSAEACDNAQKCGNEDWTACLNPDYPNWNCKPDGQSTCCISGKPYYWNGNCQECPQDEPNKCGSTCYGDEYCETGTISCENGNLACEQCPNEAPYYCARTDSCWPDKEKCDSAIKCNNEWQACNDAAYDEKCVDNQIGCCMPEYPYFCPSSNTCFKQDGLCDGRPIYNCEGKLWVCITKDYAGSCAGNELRCCPPDHPHWWESDEQCHSSQYQQKACAIPDGSSAECDCNRHSDCPVSYPYCEEEYPAPVSDGYDKCLASPPEYCGNGICDSSENYENCAQDCTAPTGKIIVDVSSTAGKPVSGAHVYLDTVPKGATDSNGKASFEADYGSRSVKVECPDKKFCESKTLNVDGTEYASFRCGCASTSQSGELQIRVRTLNSENDDGYPVQNAYVFLNNAEKGLTDAFGNLYVSDVNYGTHRLGIGLKIADKEGENPYDHEYSFDVVVDEPFESKTVNIVTPQQGILSHKPSGDEGAVLTASAYNATYVPEAIPFIVGAAVVVGFVVWSFGDYAKCVEESDSWWGSTGKLLWHNIKCNLVGLPIGQAIDKDHINSCVKKWTSIGKNTWEKCKLEGAFLVVTVIPASWVAKATGRIFVMLKGTLYSIPYVEKFLGYGYRVVKESDTIIKITDGLTEFGYKLVGGSLKIYDNIVGMLVKIMSNAGIKKEIGETVGEMLRATTFADFKAATLKSIGQIKGELGERAAVKAANIAEGELAKEGAIFVRPSGSANSVYKQSAKYEMKFNDKGKIEVFEKASGLPLGDLDDFYTVNGKHVVTEVKTIPAANLDKEIPDKWVWWPLPPKLKNGLTTKAINRLKAVKDVTGDVPEYVIMIPNGEAAASKELASHLNDVRNAGFKAEYAELGAKNSEFDYAARRIYNEAQKGGK